MRQVRTITLSGRLQARHDLNRLCAEAINRQIESGQAEPTHLRNRRRHLARQILKHIPHASRLSAKRLLHAAAMVLAMWGFSGMTMPRQAGAAPVFQHTSLAGFDVGKTAKPTFVDIDNDGDLDAFAGERNGTVKFYRNTGTAAAPNFAADSAANPLAGFDVGWNAAPAFADIDNDGDLDAFIGELYGTVKFYRNTGTATAPVFTATGANDPNTGQPVTNPLAGFDVGSYVTPTFADIDNDGDLDAFVGEFNVGVKFYRNTGTNAVPVFTATGANDPNTGQPVVNPLNGVAVGFYAAPAFADIDNDGDLDAFVGEGFGTVKFYRNTGTNAAPVFTATGANDPNTGQPVVNPLAGFDVGDFATPTFADIDNDGDLDAFVGEYNSTAKFYRNTGTTAAPVFAANPLASFNVGFYATPAFADIDNDGDLDAFAGESTGTVKFYRNTGTSAAPLFAADAAGNPLAGSDSGGRAAPAFADIDNDGDLDAFLGGWYGTVKFFRNTGTNAVPVFTATGANDPNTGQPVVNPLAGFDVGLKATPTFADIDNDGDLDAFVGESTGTVKFFRNTGTAAAPVFIATGANDPNTGQPVVNPLAGFGVGGGIRAAPAFADIDNDGDLDAFVGESYGTVKFYRNMGTAAAPNFAADAAANPLAGFNVGGIGSAPAFADIDNDGDLDAFVGEGYGTVQFFENFDPSPVTVADALTVTAGLAATTADVTANDSFKPEGPAASFTIAAFTQGAHGAVADNGDNTFTYTPTIGFTGVDSFTYTLSDGAGNTVVGTVNVTVSANSAPVPTAPAINTNEDISASSQISPNDPDVGDTQAYAVTTAATNGAASVDASGLATYAPNANFNGADSFAVTVTDAAGATGAVTINVTVNAVNDAPTAASAVIVSNEDVPSAGQTPSVTDVDIATNGDTHTFTIITQPAHGAASIVANKLVYTPSLNFNGPDAFTFRAMDSGGLSVNGTATVTMIPVNDAPVAVNDTAATPQDTPVVTGNVLTNDTDVDGDVLSVSASDPASVQGGTVVDNGDGTFTYTPPAGFSGTDSFTYTANDGNGGTAVGTVNVTVNAPAAAPDPPPPPAPAAVGVNGLFFTTGGSLMLTGAVTPGSLTGTVVDAYITITLPTRDIFYLQPDGTWSLTVAPVVASWPMAPVSGTILDYVFQGSELSGVYIFRIFFRQPGTITPVGREARRFFIFTL